MAIPEVAEIDEAKLGAFMDRAVDDLGATFGAALVVIGDKLGLYKALADAPPLTPIELAERAGVNERYAREWLNAQAAGNYVSFVEGGRYTLAPEQAFALADENSAQVADVGCGHGASTILLAQAYLTRRSTASIPTSRRSARQRGKLRRPGLRTGFTSAWPPRRRSRAACTTWWRASIACMTWVIR